MKICFRNQTLRFSVRPTQTPSGLDRSYRVWRFVFDFGRNGRDATRLTDLRCNTLKSVEKAAADEIGLRTRAWRVYRIIT